MNDFNHSSTSGSMEREFSEEGGMVRGEPGTKSEFTSQRATMRARQAVEKTVAAEQGSQNGPQSHLLSTQGGGQGRNHGGSL